MINKKLDTKTILLIITLSELIVSENIFLSTMLWFGYGVYKFFED